MRRQPTASQKERPQEKPNWMTPSSWTFRLQKCEKIQFCCLNRQFLVFCYDSPGRLIHQVQFLKEAGCNKLIPIIIMSKIGFQWPVSIAMDALVYLVQHASSNSDLNTSFSRTASNSYRPVLFSCLIFIMQQTGCLKMTLNGLGNKRSPVSQLRAPHIQTGIKEAQSVIFSRGKILKEYEIFKQFW